MSVPKKSLRVRAHPSWLALVVGTAVVSLVGSGLFAVITDSVTIAGAVVESDDYVAPGEAELDLVIGPITGGEDAADECIDADGVTYTDTDAVTAATADGTLEIARYYTDTAYASGNTPTARVGGYCIKNAGDTAGLVQMQLLSWASSEVGACSATEAAVDATCANGAAGELGTFGTVEPYVATLTSFNCKGVTGSFKRVDWNPATEVGVAKGYADLILQPGEACLVQVGVVGTRAFGIADSEWQQVVSDSAEFSIAINLVEVPL